MLATLVIVGILVLGGIEIAIIIKEEYAGRKKK